MNFFLNRDTFDVELMIYGMAEDVTEISELMEASLKFRTQIIDRWNCLTKLCDCFLAIYLVVIITQHILDYSKMKEIVEEPEMKEADFSIQKQMSLLLKQLKREQSIFTHDLVKLSETTLSPANGYNPDMGLKPIVVKAQKYIESNDN